MIQSKVDKVLNESLVLWFFTFNGWLQYFLHQLPNFKRYDDGINFIIERYFKEPIEIIFNQECLIENFFIIHLEEHEQNLDAFDIVVFVSLSLILIFSHWAIETLY